MDVDDRGGEGDEGDGEQSRRRRVRPKAGSQRVVESRSTVEAAATAATGRGRRFAVHEALDQIGAVLGPLTVAAVLVVSGGDYTPALLILAAPGVAALALLVWLRARVPDPAAYERPAVSVPRAVAGPPI